MMAILLVFVFLLGIILGRSSCKADWKEYDAAWQELKEWEEKLEQQDK